MEKDYLEITTESEINKKIKTLNKTRDNRINLSKRLEKYNKRWSAVFFFLNIEAVVFVVLTLAGGCVLKQAPSGVFTVIVGVFSIYVILTQYYVNQLNYSERALKAHYHQLDIEDLILKLKSLLLQEEQPRNSDVIREQFIEIMNEYQRILKNNENHAWIDNELREIENERKKSKKDRLSYVNEAIDFHKSKTDAKIKKVSKPLDFSPDSIVLGFNSGLIFFTLFAFIWY